VGVSEEHDRAIELGRDTLHICMDMQRLFARGGPWPTPWMDRVLPRVARLAERAPERMIFTRFLPPNKPEEMPGMWRRYYERWRHVTGDRLDPRLLELMPPLAALTPPAAVFDKMVYSAFADRLHPLLQARGVATLILSGAETDVCILSTALAAIDHGYRVIVADDAVCSSSDEGHDSLLALFRQRFSQQLQTADTASILAAWNR
jgi:nicotinamidase-related amidase